MFTALITPPPAAQADDRQRFMRLLQTALADGSFAKLLLSKYSGAEAGLERLTVRRWGVQR